MSARNRSPVRVVSAAVLVVLLAGTAATFSFARRVQHQQEDRLLRERAGEVVALLGTSFSSTESRLQLLGSVASSLGAESSRAFAVAAKPLLSVAQPTIAAVQQREGALITEMAVGSGPAPGERLSGERAAVVQRALRSPRLVTALSPADRPDRLLVALRAAPSTGFVVYSESRIDPTRITPRTPGSPFGELEVSLYASDRADPKALVLTTTKGLESRPHLDRRTFSVGSDRWFVVTGTNHPLAGSLSRRLPAIILLAGLVVTALLTLLVEVLARRRVYALELVEERTASLREAQRDAESANQAKSEFLSRMSHELRTPLNAVLGFAQILELDELAAEQQEAVAQILKGGRHLLGLINEMLDIAQVESGRLPLSPEPVLVSELAGEVLDLVRPLAAERSIHLLGGQIAECTDFAFADQQRIKQIMLNLLSNAIKYNRTGGSVAVSCDRVHEGWLRITVTDTGPGIPADRIERLFTPFERLGAERTGVEGSGIGLALSRHLAEAMGGHLGVDSEVGRGSTFWVELPLVEGPVERYERLGNGAPVVETPVPTSGRRSVLYIEDNLSNLKLVERVLAQREDVEVIAAMQGRLGLELAHEHRPVLVLLDLHLPDIGGDQVLQRLREDPLTASTPVVMVSADATPGQVQRLTAAGATAYLTKPLDVQELLRILDETLTRA